MTIEGNLFAYERMKMLTCFLVLLAAADHLCFAQFPDSVAPSANLSSTWSIHDDTYSLVFKDLYTTLKAILLRRTSTPSLYYACGFQCEDSSNKCRFAIFTVYLNANYSRSSGLPQVVWSANRDSPDSNISSLHLTSDGDLVLNDVDGATAWSTNTSGKSVVGMNITEIGNLVLFNSQNETVWQSFDHPTDILLPGQKLMEGKRLTSSISATNWTRGLYSLSISSNESLAFIESDPPQVYYRIIDDAVISRNETNLGPSYIELRNGSLFIQFQYKESNVLYNPPTSSTQYIKLESDGHLKVYEWGKGNTDREWGIVSDVLSDRDSDCGYPMVCGEYGMCLNGQCSCLPATNNEISFFEPINVTQPNQGCRLKSPLSCGASQYHEFLKFKDISYFSLIPDIVDTDMKTCKEACLRNCSCNGAFFHPQSSNSTNGTCFLPSDIFSLMTNNEKQIYSFVKVQGTPPAKADAPPPARNKNVRSKVILEASVGVVFGLFLFIGLIVILLVRKNKDVDEEEYLDQVPGMPTRFSYEELKIATEDFTEKLGEGGFGSVFKRKTK